MKRIGYLLLIVILASCSSKQEQDKLNDENVAVVQKYIKAVQEKDTKTMTDLLTDDYTGYGPSITDSVNKSQAIESWKELSENLYDKIEYIKSVNVAAYVPDSYHPGNFVSNWAHLIIRYKDGRGPVEIYANTSYRVENGKINLSRTIYDEADAMRQLGYRMVKESDE